MSGGFRIVSDTLVFRCNHRLCQYTSLFTIILYGSTVEKNKNKLNNLTKVG